MMLTDFQSIGYIGHKKQVDKLHLMCSSLLQKHGFNYTVIIYGVTIHKALSKLERSVLGLATANQTHIHITIPDRQYYKTTLSRSCCTQTLVLHNH